MRSLSKLYIVFFALIFGATLSAQETIPLYPVRFTQHYNCYSLINPALAGTFARFELSLGNQRMLGNLSKVSTYYLNANYRITRQRNRRKPFSTIGIILYNDREGKYLNRTRFYALYSWHGTIRNELKISGGLQIGGMNYSVKGTPLTGDGSDLKPDASVGIQLYNPLFHLGLSVNQVFNSEVQPLEEIALLAPFLNILGEFKLEASEWLLIKPTLSFHFPLTNNDARYSRNLYDVAILFRLQEKLTIATGIHNSDRIALTAGINNILSSSGILDVYLSYSFVYKQSTNLSTPLFELGVNYAF